MPHLQRHLETHGLLYPEQLEEALRRQEIYGGSLDTALLELELADPPQIAAWLAAALELPHAPPKLLVRGMRRPHEDVPDELASVGWAMPLKRDEESILVAVHPDIPTERLQMLPEIVEGAVPMVAPECCIEGLRAERNGIVVPQRYAVLSVAYVGALRRHARAVEAGEAEPYEAPAEPAPAAAEPEGAPADSSDGVAQPMPRHDSGEVQQAVDDDVAMPLGARMPRPTPARMEAPLSPTRSISSLIASDGPSSPRTGNTETVTEPRPVSGPPPLRFTKEGTLIETDAPQGSFDEADLVRRMASTRAVLQTARSRDAAIEATVRAAMVVSPRAGLFRIKGAELVGLSTGYSRLAELGGKVVPLAEGSPIAQAVAERTFVGRLEDPDLALAVGVGHPVPCVLLRIDVQSRPVMVLYVDNQTRDFLPAEVAQLEALCQVAGDAFEAILKLRRAARSGPEEVPAPSKPEPQPAPPTPETPLPDASLGKGPHLTWGTPSAKLQEAYGTRPPRRETPPFTPGEVSRPNPPGGTDEDTAVGPAPLPPLPPPPPSRAIEEPDAEPVESTEAPAAPDPVAPDSTMLYGLDPAGDAERAAAAAAAGASPEAASASGDDAPPEGRVHHHVHEWRDDDDASAPEPAPDQDDDDADLDDAGEPSELEPDPTSVMRVDPSKTAALALESSGPPATPPEGSAPAGAPEQGSAQGDDSDDAIIVRMTRPVEERVAPGSHATPVDAAAAGSEANAPHRDASHDHDQDHERGHDESHDPADTLSGAPMPAHEPGAPQTTMEGDSMPRMPRIPIDDDIGPPPPGLHDEEDSQERRNTEEMAPGLEVARRTDPEAPRADEDDEEDPEERSTRLTVHGSPVPPPPLPPPPPSGAGESGPTEAAHDEEPEPEPEPPRKRPRSETLPGLPPLEEGEEALPLEVFGEGDGSGIISLATPIDQPSIRGRIALEDEDWVAPKPMQGTESMQMRIESELDALEAGEGDVSRLLGLGDAALQALVARLPGPLEVLRRDMRSLPPPAAHGPLIRSTIMCGPAIVPWLIEALGHPNPDVRFYAAYIFQELRDDRCARPLAVLAFDPTADVRVISMRVLETYNRAEGFEDATHTVRAPLDGKNESDRLHAARALGTLRDVQAIPRLIDLLASKDRFVQEAAIESLCSITGQQLGLKPHRWRTWHSDNKERHRVEWIIDSLRHKDLPVRQWAAHELWRVTGHRIAFSPVADKRERESVARAWITWWTHEGRARLGA